VGKLGCNPVDRITSTAVWHDTYLVMLDGPILYVGSFITDASWKR
jgi:hypothetical protein